ncbi:MAG: hypothetical protein Q9225_005118 [Loekoesia sp. 1 TL-2023]
MRRLSVRNAMSSLLWLLRTTHALPLESPDLRSLSQLNASNFNVIPPEFKVDILPDSTTTLDSEEIYRAGTNMMYHISGYPLDHAWLDEAWASPEESLAIYLQHTDFGGKDPSHLYTQFIIWGLNHLMLSMTLSTGYRQTIAILKWNGVPVGTIHVAKPASLPSLPSDTRNQTNDTLNQLVQQNQGPHLGADDDNVEVIIDYSGITPIQKRVVYLTSIKAMGEAAEIGLSRSVENLLTTGIQRLTWRLVGGTGAFRGTLRPAHSRIAIMQTLSAMIRDRRFQKIHVWIKVNGLNTAAGGFSQGDL